MFLRQPPSDGQIRQEVSKAQHEAIPMSNGVWLGTDVEGDGSRMFVFVMGNLALSAGLLPNESCPVSELERNHFSIKMNARVTINS